eukprot:1933945-Pyramimonas_sp.AAC.1
MASHFVRARFRAQRLRKVSAIGMFLDSKAAFYLAAKQFIMGLQGGEEDLNAALETAPMPEAFVF